MVRNSSNSLEPASLVSVAIPGILKTLLCRQSLTAIAVVIATHFGAAQATNPVLEVDVRNRRILIDPKDTTGFPRDARASGYEWANLMFPSLIQVPDWAPNKLGNHYLYGSAHHGDKHLYLFVADKIEGPYRLHVVDYNGRKSSILPIEESMMSGHIAAPDVHIEEDKKRFVMWYHGAGAGPCNNSSESKYYHSASVAFSDDGINWVSAKYLSAKDGEGYVRYFNAGGNDYVLTRHGYVMKFEAPYMAYCGGGGYGSWYASSQPNYQFQIPFFGESNLVRHPGLYSQGGKDLFALYTRFSNKPERVKMMYITDITAPKISGIKSPTTEQIYEPYGISNQAEVATPIYGWEGVNGDPLDSDSEHQLRTPHIFADKPNDRFYLLYSFRGEGGFALAEINLFVDGKELLPVSGYVTPKVKPGDFTEIIDPCIDCKINAGNNITLEGRGKDLKWSHKADNGAVQSIGTGTTASFTVPQATRVTIILEGTGGKEERVFTLGSGTVRTVFPQRTALHATTPAAIRHYDVRGRAMNSAKTSKKYGISIRLTGENNISAESIGF